MTGDQRHRNDIINGQQLIRHADLLDGFYFFPTAHFLKTILASRTNGTFGFARHKSRPIAKPKETFFANAQAKCINLKSEFFKPKQLIELSN